MSLGWLSEAFWNERAWLPPNTTWQDLQNKPGDTIIKPQASDLWLTLPIAVIIYVIRYFVENVVAVKLGAAFNVHPSNKKVTYERNPKLEDLYRRKKRPNKEELEKLASKVDLPVDQLTKWYRSRRNADKASKLGRLQDSLWKFLYYSVLWTFAMSQFSTRDWAWDVSFCWRGFPYHNLDDATKWFYLVQIGFYVMCAVTHFSDVRRADFWAMLLHHFFTIGLMTASYVINHVRIGCLILMAHDIADVIMEFAKTINYLGFVNGSQYGFISFVLCWIVTRLTYYPLVLIRTVMFDVRAILGDYPFLRFFEALLVGLLVLHVYWFTLILRMVWIKLTRGHVEGDVRSDSELESSDELAKEGKTATESNKSK